mmetsp:Transcript_10093/g.22704  ORF Transcript_10093/g.22704 Transcript_10093/m.22704 type:complete len:167 (-) Transcript_10093:807-1307(-)|eukprot:CAMPEP_0178419676 /NCGR_PEP_ID=MMETSP0689_2-20121128/25733_1 /TAXON_ID=160604 /ORGANISM="Amphidinium massartii, Strain CS-259" /LENGTH=166 /DNA_ID=CAMNT_0020041121 /DNA_START=117 /DNA_END=617 /DNA_ORIENTATION=-
MPHKPSLQFSAARRLRVASCCLQAAAGHCQSPGNEAGLAGRSSWAHGTRKATMWVYLPRVAGMLMDKSASPTKASTAATCSVGEDLQGGPVHFAACFGARGFNLKQQAARQAALQLSGQCIPSGSCGRGERAALQPTLQAAAGEAADRRSTGASFAPLAREEPAES